MAASTLGRWPLLGARRLRGAVPRALGGDPQALARIVGDYIFGLDEQPASAELAESRIPDADGGGFRWTLTWRTNLIGPSWNGTEQRASTAGASPRQRFEGSFFLNDADLRVVRQFLSANPAAAYELPLPHEAVAAVVDLSGGTIYVTATYADWLVPGRRIYVRGPAGDAYTTTITGVSGGTVNVSSSPPIGGRFPAGLTIIYPLESIRLEDGNSISRYPVSVGRWGFGGRAAARAPVGTGAPAAVTHDGMRVLDRRPMQERTATEQIQGGVEFLDNGATMTSGRSWSRSRHRRDAFWLIRSPSDLQWWKAFLAERRGMWVSFLFPTWRPDLITPDYDSTEIISIANYAAEWYPSQAHRRLQIEYTDGDVDYFSVLSTIAGAGYEGSDLVELDAFVQPKFIDKISFLETCRLDTDSLTFEFTQAWRGRIAFPSVTVQESPPAPPV